MKQNNQSGFAAIVIAVIVLLALVLVIAGMVVFFLNKNVSKVNPSPSPVFTSQSNPNPQVKTIQLCDNIDEPNDCNDSLEGDNFVDDNLP